MFGLTTIRRGQRVAVWSRQGEVWFVDGPKMLPALGRIVQPLKRYSAAPGEYLVVHYQDGRIDHVRGPAALWFDPVEHAAVDVQPCLVVDSHEAIVVYRREQANVVRRVEHGPALFMPTADEWLHEFRWHGADPKRPDQRYRAGCSSPNSASSRTRCTSTSPACELPTMPC